MPAQHVRFSGVAKPDPEDAHPPGATIAKDLRRALAERGWYPADLDIEYGCWSFLCSCKQEKLRLMLAQMSDQSEWVIQIAPDYVAGPIGSLLGMHPSATEQEVLALAREVHQALVTLNFSHLQWCWNDIPNDRNASFEPQHLGRPIRRNVNVVRVFVYGLVAVQVLIGTAFLFCHVGILHATWNSLDIVTAFMLGLIYVPTLFVGGVVSLVTRAWAATSIQAALAIALAIRFSFVH